jgi:hypothetical protein
MPSHPVVHARAAAAARPAATRALATLDAATLLEAHAEAERQLARAPRCGCCLTPRVHLGRYVGSTLFLDDDPEMLRLALPPAERPRWSPRLLAACVVLYGRPRVELLPRS